jgi:flavin reductase (DIM6/NTAB) family NADH-FMN oxidoreductase RutF
MEQYFGEQDIKRLEKRYKVNLINSLSGYKSANLIGTISSSGISNVAIFSSVIHLGSEPALLGFIQRPTSVPRDTYNNIKENGCFTINQVHKNIVGKAHYSSARFSENESEFEELQLKEEYINDFIAPFVKDSFVKIGLNFETEHTLSNGCRLIIGKVQHINVSKAVLHEDGSLKLDAVDTIAVSGLDKYFIGNFEKKYPYAKKSAIKEQLKMPQKERPDNVVFNQGTKKYDAALKKYSTSVGAPLIEFNDLGNWKRIGSQRVNHHLEVRYKKIKDQYQEVLELYNWNQRIYNSKFNFEPMTGYTYHLYQKENGEEFLSQIDPSDWDKEHIGSFKLDLDRIFVKVDGTDLEVIQ